MLLSITKLNEIQPKRPVFASALTPSLITCFPLKVQAGPVQIEIAIEIGIEKDASRRTKMTLKCLPLLNWIDYDTDFDPDAA